MRTRGLRSDKEPYLSLKQMAAVLGIGPGTLRGMVKSGQVPAIPFNRRRRFLASEVRKALRAQCTPVGRDGVAE